MADVMVSDEQGKETIRYIPDSWFVEGHLIAEARVWRNVSDSFKAVMSARYTKGIPISRESEQFALFMHSLISDASTRGKRIELRILRDDLDDFESPPLVMDGSTAIVNKKFVEDAEKLGEKG